MKRLTLRSRLTLLYGVGFLVAGGILLAVTYYLVDRQVGMQIVADPPAGQPPGTDQIHTVTGEVIPAGQLAERLHRDELRALLTQGGIALAVVTIVTVGFVWLLSTRALAPLHRITETAGRIARADGGGRGLHERIALDGPRDEVKELADTFDSMLERLYRSFDGQRRFVANASHELRTPLAINRALVEVAVTRPDAAQDVRRLGETLLEVNARHERLIDGLLTLADSENEVIERSPVDLADVAAYVLDQSAGAARAAGVEPRPATLVPAPTAGDPVLLERLVHNLVENAIRHNERGGWLTVHSGAGTAGVTLTVSNTGPVIPPYEVDALFQPFRRLSRERTAERGFGLGLSIVRAVAHAHGGTVHAQPREGGGLTVTVTLPARPAPPPGRGQPPD